MSQFQVTPTMKFCQQNQSSWMDKRGNEGPSVKSLNLQMWAGCHQQSEHHLLGILGSLYCCAFASFLQWWLTSDWYIILQWETEIILILIAQLTYSQLKTCFCIQSSIYYFLPATKRATFTFNFCFYKQNSSNAFFFLSVIDTQLNRSSHLALHHLLNPRKLLLTAHWNRGRVRVLIQFRAIGHYNSLKEYSCAPSAAHCSVQHAGRQRLTAQLWRRNAVTWDRNPALPENAVCSWMFTQSRQTFSTWLFPGTHQMASCHGRSQNFVSLLPRTKGLNQPLVQVLKSRVCSFSNLKQSGFQGALVSSHTL